jgi:molecular chaperone DnaK (HSP70)
VTEPILGIDFGTSCTSAGLLIGDRVELVQDVGDEVVPSAVYAPARGQYEAGRRALMRVLSDPSGVVRSIKRVLGVAPGAIAVRAWASRAAFKVEAGSSLTLKLRGGDHAPEQIVAVLLDYVRGLAERRYGTRIKKALITTSAVPPPGYQEALTRAARIAHLELVATAPEPIAAALGANLHGFVGDRRLLICDLGGGTFDVSALVQRGLRFTALAAHGDAALGGDDFDDALAEALASVVHRQSGYDMHRDAVRWSELLFRAESAKRQLSTHAQAGLQMKDAYLEMGRPKDLSVTIDRAWAEACWQPLFDRIQRCVNELIARVRWQHGDVDACALVGGSAQIPMFSAALEALFPGRVAVAARSDVAVALGAALLTARFGAVARPVPVLEAAG